MKTVLLVFEKCQLFIRILLHINLYYRITGRKLEDSSNQIGRRSEETTIRIQPPKEGTRK